MSLVERYFPKELHGVLKALEKEQKEITTMGISELAGVSHSFLLNILPSLKDGGFVSVEKGTDKRKKLLKLTERGLSLFQALELYRAALEGNYSLIRELVKR